VGSDRLADQSVCQASGLSEGPRETLAMARANVESNRYLRVIPYPGPLDSAAPQATDSESGSMEQPKCGYIHP
jgi:hypothetical protein